MGRSNDLLAIDRCLFRFLAEIINERRPSNVEVHQEIYLDTFLLGRGREGAFLTN